jgi:YgiT-type zinc finger domain-containing protein
LSVCLKCRKKCEEVTIDYEYHGIILRNVKALRCPECKEEVFTLEQYDAIRYRLRNVIQPLKLKRKISTAGKKPIVYLPDDVVEAIDAKIGDKIYIYVEGKKIIIEKT